MQELARLSLAILTITFIGFNILYILSFEKNRLFFTEKLFISYGIGMGFVSLEMLLFYFLRAKFSILKIVAPWLILFVINLIMYYKNRNAENKLPDIKEVGGRGTRALRIFLITAISFEVLYSFFRALIKPIEAYDAVAIYAIKSKIFYLASSIPQGFFSGFSMLFPHPDYPLNIQLCETFAYLFMGNLNDQLVKVIFPLYFVGILAVLYFGIRRFGSRTYALLFTFILASIPQFNAYSTNAYIDLPLAYYCFSGLLMLLYWFKDTKSTQFIIISAVMCALAAWTKNEGIMYCLINILLLAIFFFSSGKGMKVKNKVIYTIGYVLIILVIYFPWMWIKSSAHLENDEIKAANMSPVNVIRNYDRIVPIVYEYQKQFFGPKKWNLAWILFIALFCLNFKKAFLKDTKFLTFSIIFALGGYAFIYMITNQDVKWHLSTTVSRFFIHFVPAVCYWLACILKEDVKL